MYYSNSNIKGLHRIYNQNTRKGYLRLDLNENPGGLDNTFVKAVLKDIDGEFLAKYPETQLFTEKLAEFIGVNTNEICLTNGSAEGIRHIIEVFTKPSGKIVSVTPSYAMYGVYAEMYGRTFVSVPYSKDWAISAEDIIAQLDEDVDLVVLLNPNNPIGNVYSEEDMEQIIVAAKKCHATVLIDEAYFYFYPNSFIRFAIENTYVFLVRTFSKMFSLAGCRLGYVVGQKNGIELIQKACTPHNVNAFGIKFAQAIIESGMLKQLTEEQQEGKQYLQQTLRGMKYEIKVGEGNFLFLKPKIQAKELAERLKDDARILVKHYDDALLKDFIRVTTGKREIMHQFIVALERVDKPYGK